MTGAPILPPATLGVLGSGQLGRMFAIAARQMGYRVAVFSPERNTPTGEIADFEVSAPWEDLDTVREFASRVEAITFEFENVPAAAAAAAAERTTVRPGGDVLHTTQNRVREKLWLEWNGVPVAEFRAVSSADDLEAAVRGFDGAGVAKTAGFGYDGKGQVVVRAASDAAEAWSQLKTDEAVLERLIDFEMEVSVVIARSASGEIVPYSLTRNDHANHILDVSSTPAIVAESVEHAATEVATHIVRTMQFVGVMGVEMFVTRRGDILVNELAPRTHNSGHWTLDAAATSQFEQQVRAVCGLPLGAPTRLMPAAMANLLGDLWTGGNTPDWSAALADPNVHLHLYGKQEPRPGRKMGHLTAIGSSVENAIDRVRRARAALTTAPA